ncbi:NAD(+) diphosphatase [Altericroceibacterium spongiae]|uniref:NAD(+) diphosphatase n=1 Tax=Altericroceibacterium spongiae TaxID=2320269 RepID=A0A420EJX6_9SPHN|nr:NAD(+) diphosphatase [Altericroceibacterium spongiae]RKF21021.1 NAD(+) diphosphatase [Altericroceibacterium spongiae]
MTLSAAGPLFSGSSIDRSDHIRNDPERLRKVMLPSARLLKLDGLAPVLDADNRLIWGALSEAPGDAELVFLGMRDGMAHVAMVPQAGDPDPAYAHRRIWEAIGLLQPEDLATYGTARSLVDWHARHRFCAVCGHTTRPAKGGWQRDCSNGDCAASHFPRTDPVAIMLVEHEGRLLLGRGLNFPERRYSALAGFVEPGESIEECVAREVEEESGIRVRDVKYIASQPWPFPSQLMLGCHAMAINEDITRDETELADIDWFTKDEIEAALAGDHEDNAFIAPPAQAIAHYMLRWWVAQQ